MPMSPALADSGPSAPLSALALSWQLGSHEPVPGLGVAGVYVVWRTGRLGRECLVVGEARDIATDLACAFRDSHVAAYAASGALEVSWAAAASLHRPGIARYLATMLSPAISMHSSQARLIPVNLPG